jgi:carbamoyl-phosphate synthase large subunit
VSIPRANPGSDRQSQSYLDALTGLAAEVDFVYVSLESEIEVIAGAGLRLPTPSNLAAPAVLALVLDKLATERVAKQPRDFPRTAKLDPDDPGAAFSELGAPLWIRPAAGTSGIAGLQVSSEEEAAAWLKLWESRAPDTHWMAQEYLPGRNLNWSAVYREGECVAAACMERLSYLLAPVAVSGITGQVKLCQTVAAGVAGEVADRVVRALDAQPHGVYSVDLRENAAGHPCVTEINPRLAGRPLLFARAGVNLPLAALRALCNQPIGDAVAPGGMQVGLQMYRQVDVEPLFGSG